QTFYDVTADLQLNFDSSNTGHVTLGHGTHQIWSAHNYRNGTYTHADYPSNIPSAYIWVSYEPKRKQPSEIRNSQDNIIIDISISSQPSTTTQASSTTTPSPTTTTKTTTAATTPTTTTTTTTTISTTTPSPKPASGSGPYCNCSVDKFGFPIGWRYNDIWLDVVVILDTSEAMGKTALMDAGALIESFISDGDDDFLITETNAPFYTRVGVISMAEKATVMYNLNMTKTDKVQGKAWINEGFPRINVVDAYEAALKMFNEGLISRPERVNARQVIYYMTDSDPKNNLNVLNQFKASQGVIIVNNFLEEGEVELTALKELASKGYYFSNDNYAISLQSFCKANCFCQREKNALGGTDPATKASGGCYHPAPAGVPFNKAQKTCENTGGNLASIHDAEKGRFVQQLMSKVNSNYFWFGYNKSDDGAWKWTDQSTDSYTNWDVNEPNSAAVAKCAYMDATTAGLKWGAGNCQMGFPYVCQYTPCSVG
ncbi:hypothetical protein PENTCL1PPCAC_21094, partial [Pristionchus entomophagus]